MMLNLKNATRESNRPFAREVIKKFKLKINKEVAKKMFSSRVEGFQIDSIVANLFLTDSEMNLPDAGDVPLNVTEAVLNVLDLISAASEAIELNRCLRSNLIFREMAAYLRILSRPDLALIIDAASLFEDRAAALKEICEVLNIEWR